MEFDKRFPLKQYSSSNSFKAKKSKARRKVAIECMSYVRYNESMAVETVK